MACGSYLHDRTYAFDSLSNQKSNTPGWCSKSCRVISGSRGCLRPGLLPGRIDLEDLLLVAGLVDYGWAEAESIGRLPADGFGLQILRMAYGPVTLCQSRIPKCGEIVAAKPIPYVLALHGPAATARVEHMIAATNEAMRSLAQEAFHGVASHFAPSRETTC